MRLARFRNLAADTDRAKYKRNSDGHVLDCFKARLSHRPIVFDDGIDADVEGLKIRDFPVRLPRQVLDLHARNLNAVFTRADQAQTKPVLASKPFEYGKHRPHVRKSRVGADPAGPRRG